ncbi:unnamed protein product [Chilo suppressalis]|uniref:Reverse transcriptase domain-containing protein n=1 Tax=Chilo suppressalis TaxID=168631 RepID=A0ABN8BD29_CHISP|nr:unnamed protein product [Chilo suppressalis]
MNSQALSPQRKFKKTGLLRHIRSAHNDALNQSAPVTLTISTNGRTPMSPLEDAFGSPFFNAVGPKSGIWQQRWDNVCNLHGKMNDLPSGTASRKFVHTLADEIEHLTKSTYPSERVLTFAAVILQRDKNVRKTKDVLRLLDRRLKLWTDERFEELITESIKADKSLRNAGNRKRDDQDTKTFTRLIREALNWLLTKDTYKVLNPDAEVDPSGKTVSYVLTEKHPPPTTPDHDLFTLPRNDTELPPLLEVDITSDHVETVARKLHGGGGPTGSTAENWRDFLLRYGQASALLREAVVQLTMKLSNETVPRSQIQALMSSRLVALDKCPCMRPIGIGECLRRILSKCMIEATSSEVTEACGQLQLCSGLSSGIEGAVHAMKDAFQKECHPRSNWGMLLVDANNAFNAVNRQLELWQARIHWPHCARFLYNTYNGHAELVFRDSGTRLYMPLYALATLPIINKLKSENTVTQCWYADDSSA